MMNDFTVIIRSVDERTEELCKALLQKEIPDDNLFIIREVPFSKALRESIFIGIDQQKKWTICIDADILIRKNAISTLLSFSESLPDNTFKVIPYFLDKFFNTYRGGGMHLYRTKLLPEAIGYIPEEGEDLRPESQMFLQMKEKGYETIVAPYLIAIHDYEQYYKDIFRKCYVYAHKWVHWTEHFLETWREKAELDKDFQVALYGLSAGIAASGQVHINKDLVPYELLSVFAQGQIKEKSQLNSKGIDFDYVENIISTYDQEFLEKVEKPYLQSLRANKDQKRTYLYKFLYTIGDLLIKGGNRLKKSLSKI